MGRWPIPPQQKKPVTVKITDLNGDGRISVSELRKGLRESLGGDIFSTFYKSWVAANKADMNRDGFISNVEMEGLKSYASSHWNIDLTVSIVDAYGRHINQRLATFFPPQQKKPVIVKITDLNGDGRISVSELRKGLRESLGGDIFSTFYKSWAAANNAGTNRDGFISDAEMKVLKNFASSHWNIELTAIIFDANGRLID